jgi:hypothetical protein
MVLLGLIVIIKSEGVRTMLEIIIGGFILFLFLKLFFYLGFGLLKVALFIVGLSLLGVILPIGLGLMLPIIIIGVLLHMLGWFLGLLF